MQDKIKKGLERKIEKLRGMTAKLTLKLAKAVFLFDFFILQRYVLKRLKKYLRIDELSVRAKKLYDKWVRGKITAEEAIPLFIVAILFVLSAFIYDLAGRPHLMADSMKTIADGSTGFLITIFGFSLTIRNILISRETTKYKQFEQKAIIANTSNRFHKTLWYILAASPVICLVSYGIGYRGSLFWLVLSDLIVMLGFFWYTMHRLDDSMIKKSIAERLVHSLFCENHVSYRCDLIKKICTLDEFNTSVNDSFAIYSYFIDRLIEYSSRKRYRATFLSSILTNRTMRRIRKGNRKSKKQDEHPLFFERKLYETYYYSYDYLRFFIQENLSYNQDKLIDNVLELFKKCSDLLDIPYKKNDAPHASDSKLSLILYINFVFGLLQACFESLPITDIKRITEGYLTCGMEDREKFFLIKKLINALQVVSINYCLLSESIYGSNILIDIKTNYADNVICTQKEDFELLFKYLIPFDRDETMEEIRELLSDKASSEELGKELMFFVDYKAILEKRRNKS